MVPGTPAPRDFNAKPPVMKNKKNPDYACKRGIGQSGEINDLFKRVMKP